MIGILLAIVLTQQPDHSPKPCVVIEIVTEGVRSDCHGWKPAKGEKVYAPAEINKQLRVGDTFYFAWQETRWVASLSLTATTCTVVNLSPVAIVCNEGPEQVELRDFQWPAVWGQTHLTGKYNAEIVGSKVVPLPTGPVVDNETLRQQSLREQRRWRIPPTQSVTRN